MAKYRGYKSKFKYGKKRLVLGKRNGTWNKNKFDSSENRQLTSESFKKLGAHSDSSFVDTTSIVYYAWEEVNPLYNETPKIPKGKSGRLPSLKNICSRIVAQNTSDINSSMLQSLSWPCIKLIWNHILVSHNDSLSAFITFSTTMFQLQDFRCHSPPIKSSDELVNLRQDYLTHCLIPNVKTHRIENLFSNVNIHNFTVYLNTLRIQRLVFLDFSHTSGLLKREDFLLLFKVGTLAGLDFSNNTVLDDTILSYLVMAIKNDRLPYLRIIRLSNCKKLSKASIEELFLLSANGKSCLSLVICDDIFSFDFYEKLSHNAANKIGKQLPGTNWVHYNHEWEPAKLLMKFPLAFQYHYLQKELKQRLSNFPYETNDYIMLDFMFCDQIYGFDSQYYMLDYILKQRISSRNKFLSSESCLLIDTNLDVKPKVPSSTASSKELNAIFTSVNSNKKSVAKVRSKPKRKNVNVNDFF